MGKIRGTHSSPGVYTQITDLSYASKTLGITTLAAVGETLKGPAFEPMLISDYNQFQTYFGGCSAEKYEDSQYPRYQLPYIAKEYLQASDRLYVCRVLGLSGYNAGPAFVITAEDADSNDNKKYVVAVLRSRGHFNKYGSTGAECDPDAVSTYDTIEFDCDEIKLQPYTNLETVIRCGVVSATTDDEQGYKINALNRGQFTIVAYKNEEEVGRYPVSLNAGTKDYIYNVLGSKATEGTAKVFVEELYDIMLDELIQKQMVNAISESAETINQIIINPVAEPVRDFVTIPSDQLTRKEVGQSFIYADKQDGISGETTAFTYVEISGGTTVSTGKTMGVDTEGYVFTVQAMPSKDGITYQYVFDKTDPDHEAIVSEITSADTKGISNVDAVQVLSINAFVCLDEHGDVSTFQDLSDYHDQFRCASTPWVVSELKGDGKDIQVKKLFRFHTISDGTDSNTEVKISITNIRPDDGTFDVLVRDFGDSDGNPTILESYKNVTMVPGDPKYIGLQIGTLDGAYELKSKYVMVEIIENDMTRNCVPAGFLGYPVRDYSGQNMVDPTLTYNTNYNEDIRPKKQYFGMSELVGIDTDILSYKGKDAYHENITYGYTQPFHLDSTLNEKILSALTMEGQGTGLTVTIDGDPETAGITWSTVNPNNVTKEGKRPVIGSEEYMEGTIYEDKNLRKFTMCFYGGFDGWDIYRKSRTNTDEFKANKYKGKITNGYGQTFSKIQDGTYLALEGNCITSDYYAFLAGVNQFEIPEKYVVNLFATPGIDYVNNTSLVEDTLEMLEEKRKDTLYVVDTPDKPWGSSDAIDEMYSSADAAENLEDVGIDTYYACTYYPWIKYFDGESNKFINLPATKDALRNMANVDNKYYPWIASAGLERGNVNCTRMHFFAKLEDEDNVYDGRINPLKTFSKDGVKIWGNKTMYTGDTPMNRVNTVRLVLYMRKLITEASMKLIFEPNDVTLKAQFEDIINPILADIKANRGITDYRLKVDQTPEMMDAHEMQAALWIKPTPTLEYLEINFIVTPQSVSFEDM